MAFQFNPLSSSFDIVPDRYTLGASVFIHWKNITVGQGNGEIPLYTSFQNPTDEYGNPFVMPSNFRGNIKEFGAIIKDIGGSQTAAPQTAVFKGGITVNAANVGTASLKHSNNLICGKSGNTVIPYVQTATQSYTSPGKGIIEASSTPQLVVIIEGIGDESYLVVQDFYASITLLPLN